LGNDDTGDCDGDLTCDDEDESDCGEAALSFSGATTSSIDIDYTSDVAIYGFQFDYSGVDLTGASSDLGNVSCGATTCLGFSFIGGSLPDGSGTLVSLTFVETFGSTISTSDVVIAGVGGNELFVQGPDPADIPACADTDDDAICDVYDDCVSNGADNLTDGLDCNGDCNGTASTDNCGDCVGGQTGETACEQDCNDDWGGTAPLQSKSSQVPSPSQSPEPSSPKQTSTSSQTPSLCLRLTVPRLISS
jgi:hypothetical protein